MNNRSEQLISMLEKHLQQQTSLEETRVWLRKTYHSIRSPFREDVYKPSNELEFHVVRVTLSIMDDVRRNKFSPSTLEWYWEHIKQHID